MDLARVGFWNQLVSWLLFSATPLGSEDTSQTFDNLITSKVLDGDFFINSHCSLCEISFQRGVGIVALLRVGHISYWMSVSHAGLARRYRSRHER